MNLWELEMWSTGLWMLVLWGLSISSCLVFMNIFLARRGFLKRAFLLC